MTSLSTTEQPYRSAVLEGLAHIGLTGRDMAALSDVSAPTVSKWRGGKSRPPAMTVIFLTLVLAHKVEELEDLEWQLDPRDRDGWAHDIAGQLEGARGWLRSQEARNAAISPESIHEGARRFRDWLNSGAECGLFGLEDGADGYGDGLAAGTPAGATA